MTGADFIELLNSIDPTIKIPSHNVTSIAKQATIAYEHGISFWQVLVDYSKKYSFTFTINALGLNKATYAYCKPLFTYRLMQKQERPYLIGNRRHSYYPPIPKTCPVSKSGVYWRLNNGWTWEQAVSTPSTIHDKNRIRNLGNVRNTTVMKSLINRDCEEANAYGKHSTR